MILFRRHFVGRDAPDACPEPSRLRDLIEEAVPPGEQEGLTAHVGACPDCQRRLEELAGGEPPHAPEVPARQGPELARVIDELRRLPFGLTTQDGRGDASDDFSDEPPLSFLQPSESPEHLGRFGPYEILDVLGRGGMGIVLKGFDATLHRVVAIKVLAPELAASGAARKRFAREARAAAAVCHDHVVPIHAVDSAGGLPYLVMQYVPGRSLQDRLDAAGPLQVEEILRIGLQTAQGLAAAHAQGLIHRDIKPANIMLENGVERVRITDFSLARTVDDASVTRSGFLAGTPAYMAPEQARGDAIDHRADLFSLGSVLYAMATGRPPFRASTTLAVLRRVCEESPTPVQDLNPSIPEWLVMVIDRLHAKEPGERFQTADEAAQALGACLAHAQNPRLHPLPPGLTRPVPPRRSGWLARAVLPCILLLAVLLAPGVVMRIRTPQGTLLVEVDDPTVQVAVDGQEVTLTGKGVGEVRLKPGSYRLDVSKDGKPVKTEIVNVERGGKRLVRVTLDPTGATAADVALRPLELQLHQGEVSALAFSPDGQLLLSGGGDKIVNLVRTTDGKVVRTIKGHTARIVTAALLPDTLYILSLDADGLLILTDSKTGKEVVRLKLGGGITDARIVGQGARVIGQDRTGLRVWDVGSGKVVNTLTPRDGTVTNWNVDVQGRWLAVCDKVSCTLYDASSSNETPTATWTQKFEPVRSLAFSPDGRTLVSATEDESVILWEAATGKQLTSVPGSKGTASPDGKTLATVHDGAVRTWDLATGKSAFTFELPRSATVTQLAFSPDGAMLAWATRDGKVFLVRLRPAPAPVIAVLEEYAQQRLYTEALKQAMRLLEADPRPGNTWGKAQEARVSPHRHLEWRILQRRLERGKEDAPLFVAKGAVRAVAFTPDARLAVASDSDGLIRIHDVASGKELRKIHTPFKVPAWSLAVSPDAREVASVGADGTVHAWDLATGKQRLSIKTKLTALGSVAYSPDGKQLGVAGEDDGKGVFSIFAADSGKLLVRQVEDGQRGNSLGLLVWAPDMSAVATAGDRDFLVRVWDHNRGQVKLTFRGHTGPIRALAYSPDGKRLATAGDDRTVKIWDLATGKLITSVAHQAAVQALAYSADGRRLLTGSADGAIHFLEGTTGWEVLSLPGHSKGVTALAVSPDNNLLLSGGEDDRAILWGR